MTLRQLRLPSLPGDGTVTLEHWYKQPGEPVTPGDPLLLVRTEHFALDLPAPIAGTLAQHCYDAGETIPVGTTFATLDQEDSSLTEPPAPLASHPTPRPVRVSPLARKLATVHAYDLTTITGSGYGGRIVQADIVRLQASLIPQSACPEGAPTPALSPRPLSPQSSSLAPTVLTAMQVQLDAALTVGHRARQGPRGVELTLASCVAHAVSQELLTHHLLQAVWDDDGLILPRQTTLAIEDGSVSRVIPDAAALSLLGIARSLASSSAAADITRAFSIRTTSAHWTEAWLAPGSTATLTIGSPTVRPIVVATLEGDRIEPHPTALLTLCYDARILTQPEADAFLWAVKRRVECLHGA
ncbi:MAG: E3 binding domain-containing protein [Herpetosiphonaceae bacterium]|nr:E3 binding domain-containing protein [Herpetosiphonaceae bacterium]